MSRLIKFFDQINVPEMKTIGKAEKPEKSEKTGGVDSVDADAVINKISETYNPQGKLDDFLKEIKE